VYFVCEGRRSISDYEIASFALEPPRIILTEDKDFGRLAFEEFVAMTGVVYLRIGKYDAGNVKSIVTFFRIHPPEALIGMFVTLKPEKQRFRVIFEK
jgi:predicted nuclease of predicted toxin-antitoxin system